MQRRFLRRAKRLMQTLRRMRRRRLKKEGMGLRVTKRITLTLKE